MQKQLNVRQLCLFCIAFLPLTKLFIMPSILASNVKGDLWLSALINIAIDFFAITVYLVATKNVELSFIEMMEDAFGKTTTKIICFIYALFFAFRSILPVLEQKDYIDYTLYFSMPSLIYFLPFFVSAFYLSMKKLRVLGRLSDVLFTFTIVGYVLLLALSLGNTDLTEILPIGNSGILNILDSSRQSITWFGDCIYFLFFIGNFKKEKGYLVKILLSFLLSGVMVVIFLIVFYGIFSSIAFRQRFALTEIAKYTSVISDTGRFDYLAIISLLFSFIVSSSLPLFFASKLINYVFTFKVKFISPLIVCLVPLITIVFLYQQFYSIENFIINFTIIPFTVLSLVFPIVFLICVNRRFKNEVLNT